MLVIPLQIAVIPRVLFERLSMKEEVPLWEQEEEHREEDGGCEEALLESRAMKAQETEVVVANMLMFCVCVCFCVYMRACLSCEEKPASFIH